MRLGSLRGSLRLLSVFVLGLGVGLLGAPLWRTAMGAWFQEKYGLMTFRCDQAMREHLIAKQTVAREPSDETVKTVKQAELGLLDCQDYDMLRKRLITFGLTENDLSLMSLRAIEERAVSLQRVVETHEIRY